MDRSDQETDIFPLGQPQLMPLQIQNTNNRSGDTHCLWNACLCDAYFGLYVDCWQLDFVQFDTIWQSV